MSEINAGLLARGFSQRVVEAVAEALDIDRDGVVSKAEWDLIFAAEVGGKVNFHKDGTYNQVGQSVSPSVHAHFDWAIHRWVGGDLERSASAGSRRRRGWSVGFLIGRAAGEARTVVQLNPTESSRSTCAMGVGSSG